MGTGLLPTPHICAQSLRPCASPCKAFIARSPPDEAEERKEKEEPAGPPLSRLPLLGAQRKACGGCWVPEGSTTLQETAATGCRGGGGARGGETARQQDPGWLRGTCFPDFGAEHASFPAAP